MSSTTPKPSREEYDAWYEQCRAQCPPGASLPAYDPPREPDPFAGSARMLEAVVDRLDLPDFEFSTTTSDRGELDSVYFCAVGLDDIKRSFTVHRCESPDQAAAEALASLRAWPYAALRVCGECLGSLSVLSTDYPGHLASCGDCLGGTDDGEPPLTMAEREHDEREALRRDGIR